MGSSLLIALGLLMAATTASAEVRIPQSLATRTAASFAGTARLTDDPLEFRTTISTEKGHDRAQKISGSTWGDTYLRATIDKRTGETRFEVVAAIRYWGPQREYRSVHYADATGLRSSELTMAEHGASTCPNVEFTNFTSDCLLTKKLAFEIDERTIRAIADDAHSTWAFKLKDKAENDLVAAIVPAEAAGLLQVVSDYRLRRGTALAAQ